VVLLDQVHHLLDLALLLEAVGNLDHDVEALLVFKHCLHHAFLTEDFEEGGDQGAVGQLDRLFDDVGGVPLDGDLLEVGYQILVYRLEQSGLELGQRSVERVVSIGTLDDLNEVGDQP